MNWILSVSFDTNGRMNHVLQEHAILISYGFGEVMSEVNDAPDGIYIVVSGMVKIHYYPTESTIQVSSS